MTHEGPPSTVDEVRAVYERLMSAFGNGDADAYVACFHPDAPFLFRPTPEGSDLGFRSWALEDLNL